jgi:hypothetical protein
MANIKENKKYHYTYKTTNLINDRYYLGMHSTNRLDDGYLGSGKRLYYELNKYGRDNFKFEILKEFNSREELVQAEINLITEQDLKNPNCLNLKSGGSGGWSEEVREKGKVAAKTYMEEKWTVLEYREKMMKVRYDPTISKIRNEKTSKTLKQHFENTPGTFKGKKHKPESIDKMKESHKRQGSGNKNSQYGTCWITDEYCNKKIIKGELIPEGWRLGRKIKKSS